MELESAATFFFSVVVVVVNTEGIIESVLTKNSIS